MSEKRDNQLPIGGAPPPGGPATPHDREVKDAAPEHARPTCAGSGDPAYRNPLRGDVEWKISGNDPEPLPRRLRRLHRVWPDRDGNISYLLTMCVDGRGRVLDNEITFQRLVGFLLDSPQRYGWFGRRFVIMPDHIHLIARMGYDAARLGQWIKALKAVVGGLERRERRPPPPPGAPVGPVPSPGGLVAAQGGPVGAPGLQPGLRSRELARIKRSWRWQDGYHDHKFRTPESESRKWEYVCLNPVRYGLVKRPEDWPFGGEIFYDSAGDPPVGPVPSPGGPRLVRGTPPLLATGILVEEDGRVRRGAPARGESEPAGSK